MALAKAIITGMAAGIAAPFATRDLPADWARMVRAGSMRVDLGGAQLYWSWPVFCAVTLIVFLLLRAMEGR